MGFWSEDDDANDEYNRTYELALMGLDANGRPPGWEKEEDEERRRKAGFKDKSDAEWAEEKERIQIQRDFEEDRLLYEIVHGKIDTTKSRNESEHGKNDTIRKKIKVVIKRKQGSCSETEVSEQL